MSRWLGVGILFLFSSSLGCNESSTGVAPAVLLDQLQTREDAYHSTVGTLSSAAAIRSETAKYASDMHSLLEDMGNACRETMRGGSMMSGYTLEDMTEVMDQMRTCVDDYTSRVKRMEVKETMMDACNEHHAAMNEMLNEMDVMVRDIAPCCSGT